MDDSIEIQCIALTTGDYYGDDHYGPCARGRKHKGEGH
jgi:hypothetical protein